MTAPRGRPRNPPCDGCGHAFHRDGCPRKGPSGCVPVLDRATGQPYGFVCYDGRGPCPCPFGACHACGAPIAGASTFPLGDEEVDVDRGSAGDPGGRWAVRRLADGRLAARPLGPGAEPGEGWWRGRAHVHQLAGVTATWDAPKETADA